MICVHTFATLNNIKITMIMNTGLVTHILSHVGEDFLLDLTLAELLFEGGLGEYTLNQFNLKLFWNFPFCQMAHKNSLQNGKFQKEFKMNQSNIHVHDQYRSF